MIFIRHNGRGDGGLALLRPISLVSMVLVIVMLAAALSMGQARASVFAQSAQDHCATMDVAEDDARHPASDTSHPATKVMNCAMTCAFILGSAPLTDPSRHLFDDKRPMDFSAPLAGIGHHLDLPPPKG